MRKTIFAFILLGLVGCGSSGLPVAGGNDLAGVDSSTAVDQASVVADFANEDLSGHVCTGPGGGLCKGAPGERCNAGEWCDNGTCRCGTGNGCATGTTCASGGAMVDGNNCGSICCGGGSPCPL